MMRLSLDDTIAAIASAPGGAARGIVRLSGPQIFSVLANCFDSKDSAIDQVRRATMLSGEVRLANLNLRLPSDLLLWPNHRSYTGQPSAELHMVGSPPLLQAVLDAVCAAGCRPAAPGEFTLRAVLTGRLDLTQAEAVLGVINASGDRELRVALDQLAGGLGAPLRKLRGELLDALAHLEAGLDFVEEDIEFVTRDELSAKIDLALDQIARFEHRLDDRATSYDLPRVVLVGLPNVGKSSLFNALAGGPSAIVSHIAGTTRDYLSARINLDGVECELVDTAGIDNSTAKDSIDGTAQQLTRSQHERAHVELFCIDMSRLLTEWEHRTLSGKKDHRIVVGTKIDLKTFELQPHVIPTSACSGAGLDRLRAAIRTAVLSSRMSDGPVVATTAARCRESLRNALVSLREARQLVESAGGDELIAAELRLSLDALGEVVGAVYTDDILDRIFSRFCIGK